MLQLLADAGYVSLPPSVMAYSAELGRYVLDFPLCEVCEGPLLHAWLRAQQEEHRSDVERKYLHSEYYADLTYIHESLIDRFSELRQDGHVIWS